MKVRIYAGSLRPGGGLTVLSNFVDELAKEASNEVVVYVGAQDSETLIWPVISKYKNVTLKRFLPKVPSAIRYFLSKLSFLVPSLLRRKELLVSFNYYIPTFSKLFVYHINLLHFQKGNVRTLLEKVKDFDAKLACKRADYNAFESQYLLDEAKSHRNLTVTNPSILYIGINEAFHVIEKDSSAALNEILVVSSPQPHKDNYTCLLTLKYLIEQCPEVYWRLSIAGGQRKDQWDGLIKDATQLGVHQYIELLGPLNKLQLNEKLNQVLCLMTASRVESFCMVAVEAMAAGCPALVTNLTSMPESVGGAGIVVPAGDYKRFGDEIVKIYKFPEHRASLVSKGIEHANKFTVKDFGKSLRRVLKSV